MSACTWTTWVNVCMCVKGLVWSSCNTLGDTKYMKGKGWEGSGVKWRERRATSPGVITGAPVGVSREARVWYAFKASRKSSRPALCCHAQCWPPAPEARPTDTPSTAHTCCQSPPSEPAQ